MEKENLPDFFNKTVKLSEIYDLSQQNLDHEDECDLYVEPNTDYYMAGADFAAPMSSFSLLRNEMSYIDEGNLIMKKIEEPGFGGKISPDTQVLVHFSMFLKGCKEPFDSTFNRNRPEKFQLGEGAIIEGLEEAMKSMETGETSCFILSWPVAFGEYGCPPRIPPKADIFLRLELLKIGQLLRKERTFVETIDVCKKLNVMAKDLFRRKIYCSGMRKLLDAIKILQPLRTSCDDEAEEAKNLKLHIYSNLAGMCNYMNRPRMALIQCNAAMLLDENYPNILFNAGRAYLKMHLFQEAEECLIKGRKLYPDDQKFATELEKIKKKTEEIQ